MSRKLSLVLGCAAFLPILHAGPISVYYVTAGDETTNWALQGSGVVNSWTQNFTGGGGEYAIAVPGSIRTLGNGNSGDQGPGSDYTLGGTFTGTTYNYPVGGPLFYDGTSDGTNNYAVDFSTGNVYQTSSVWTSPVILFTSAGNLGITYDNTNNSLWISDWSGTGTIRDYSLAGTLLSSFTTPFGDVTSLAMDYADNTLWMGSQTTEGTFYQYSRTGVQLSTQVYGALVTQNTLGGEFAITAVPEPATFGMLGLALTALFAARRARR